MSPGWPYPRSTELPPRLARPSWRCPEDACSCHPPDVVEDEFVLQIVLRDHELNRMADAVCLIEAPGLIGEAVQSADGDGVIEIAFWRAPKSVVISWAPKACPMSPLWPLRKLHYVDLPEDDRFEAAARRLHNLGFNRKTTLAANIAEFQRSYGYTLTAELDDVEEPLRLHHDGGADQLAASSPEPPSVAAAPALAEQRSNIANIAPNDDLADDPSDVIFIDDHQVDEPVADPVAQADPPPAGGTGKRKKTTAASVQSCPSPVDGVVWPYLLYEFGPIKSSYKGYEATFWVLRDAVKWYVPPGNAEWYKSPQSPDPIHGNEMLCRIPCTARDQQDLADLITTTPRRLSGDEGQPDMAAVASLLPTTLLYDLRYRQADAKIPPFPKNVDPAVIVTESRKMNYEINETVNKKFSVSAPPKIIADPGKAWVITHQVNRTKAKDNGHFAAVNYGWHKSDTKVIQGPGTHHCACHHVDYSQICFLVAGYCLIEGNEFTTPTWVKTERVYTTDKLCGLAVAGAVKLPDTRYTRFGLFKP